MNELTGPQLTDIYNWANGIRRGKRPAITTEFVFAAMRAAHWMGSLTLAVQND